MKAKPTIVPIVAPKINWHDFVSTIMAMTGRSPTRILDASGIRVGDDLSFLLALNSFQDNQGILSHTLSHVSYTFLVEMKLDDYFILLKETSFDCVDTRRSKDEDLIVLISGSLFEWKQAIVTFSDPQRSFWLRYTFNAIYLMLCNSGLSDVFHGIRKTELLDQTLSLEWKK
jgi:hypothetical protein